MSESLHTEIPERQFKDMKMFSLHTYTQTTISKFKDLHTLLVHLIWSFLQPLLLREGALIREGGNLTKVVLASVA
ncbi:hypothetical protein L1987_01164 [Smallanthus sonchifolius]|uniref:Uncharacterized protein n=1 Tax=Smallanthus sonchifolius TaxID=185202 RepID=A0ACB9K468_9ASTR|nr:hypothetical protein L1987_01164 [Smallanthus sonchifolius]